MGRITAINRPNGTETLQGYDATGNMSFIRHQGSWGVMESFDYTYDAAGNRLVQTEADGALTTYEYDPLHRLTKVTYPVEKIRQIQDTFLTPPNSSNPSSGKTDTGSSDGEKDQPSNSGKKNEIQSGSGTSPVLAAIKGDNGNQGNSGSSGNAAKDNDNGNSGNAGQNEKPDNNDKRGVGNSNGLGLERGKHKGWYKNGNGRPVELPSPGEYELPAYLMEPQTQVSYEYDEAGNRIRMVLDPETVEYSYDEAERLVTAGSASYEYDDAGNLTAVYRPDGAALYDYDAAGRLSEVWFNDGTWLGYLYDGFGRKVSREEDYWHPEDKEHRLRTETTGYLYDGVNVMKEYTGEGSPLAEYYQGNGQTIARNMFGYHGRKDEGRDGNLRTRGGLLNYHYDALGNITNLTDRVGEEIARYRFDAFGGMFAGPLAPYSFQGITGKEYDPKSGLVNFGARWYDPTVVRFTQADTFKGFAFNPTTQHPYAFVGNNLVLCFLRGVIENIVNSNKSV
jgi:RHS repeat-associated protein